MLLLQDAVYYMYARHGLLRICKTWASQDSTGRLYMQHNHNMCMLLHTVFSKWESRPWHLQTSHTQQENVQLIITHAHLAKLARQSVSVRRSVVVWMHAALVQYTELLICSAAGSLNRVHV